MHWAKGSTGEVALVPEGGGGGEGAGGSQKPMGPAGYGLSFEEAGRGVVRAVEILFLLFLYFQLSCFPWLRIVCLSRIIGLDFSLL